MSENLVKRVTRLISSGANSLIDAIENAAPEVTMREAIREVERAMDDVRDEMVHTVAAGHHASRRLRMARDKLEELNEKACVAVAQERDDLAQAALSRQLDIESQIPDLETAIKEASAKQAELDGFIAALLQRKKEMEADLASFVASRRQAADAAGIVGGGSARDSVERRAENAHSVFERALAAGTGQPAGIRADRETAAKLIELDRVSREIVIAERLAAIKSTRQAV